MEKSDKRSIILASIFLVILLACLGFVVYIKMTYDLKDNNNVNNNNSVTDNPTILSLDNIISSFNSSKVVSDYFALGTTLAMEKSDNGFNITYSSEDASGIIEGTYIAYTLSIKFNKDNTEIANDVFKELVNISCKNQKYTDGECNTTVDKFLTENYTVDGLTYEKVSDEEIYLKVNTVKKLELYVENNTYKAEEPIDIKTNGYTISSDEYELSSSVVNYDDATKKFTYNAKVKNLLNSGSNVKVELKLYDENNTVLVTEKVDNSASSDKNNFDVLFDITLNSEVSYESIKYLSVNFINE